MSRSSLQKAKSKVRLRSQADAHFVIANHTDNTFNLEELRREHEILREAHHTTVASAVLSLRRAWEEEGHRSQSHGRCHFSLSTN